MRRRYWMLQEIARRAPTSNQKRILKGLLSQMSDLPVARVLRQLHEGLPIGPLHDEEEVGLPVSEQRHLRHVALHQYTSKLATTKGAAAAAYFAYICAPPSFLNQSAFSMEIFSSGIGHLLSGVGSPKSLIALR